MFYRKMQFPLVVFLLYYHFPSVWQAYNESSTYLLSPLTKLFIGDGAEIN